MSWWYAVYYIRQFTPLVSVLMKPWLVGTPKSHQTVMSCVVFFLFAVFLLGHCRLGRVRNLSSSMVVPALMSMIVASIEKLFYFHCRPSPPEMHQKHFYIPASLSSVFNLYNSTHIDRHTIKLSIIRGLARKNMVPKKHGKWGSCMETWKNGSTCLLRFAFMFCSCFFLRSTWCIVFNCSCHLCNYGSQLASMCKKLCARSMLILVNRHETVSTTAKMNTYKEHTWVGTHVSSMGIPSIRFWLEVSKNSRWPGAFGN